MTSSKEAVDHRDSAAGAAVARLRLKTWSAVGEKPGGRSSSTADSRMVHLPPTPPRGFARPRLRPDPEYPSLVGQGVRRRRRCRHAPRAHPERSAPPHPCYPILMIPQTCPRERRCGARFIREEVAAQLSAPPAELQATTRASLSWGAEDAPLPSRPDRHLAHARGRCASRVWGTPSGTPAAVVERVPSRRYVRSD